MKKQPTLAKLNRRNRRQRVWRDAQKLAQAHPELMKQALSDFNDACEQEGFQSAQSLEHFILKRAKEQGIKPDGCGRPEDSTTIKPSQLARTGKMKKKGKTWDQIAEVFNREREQEGNPPLTASAYRNAYLRSLKP